MATPEQLLTRPNSISETPLPISTQLPNANSAAMKTPTPSLASTGTSDRSSNTLPSDQGVLHSLAGPIMTSLVMKFPSENPASPSKLKPVIVGIYGISGCGKSYLIGKLKEMLGEEQYSFHDGSGLIGRVVPGGLDAFMEMEKEGKDHYRVIAIETVQNECAESGKVGIVTGHHTFWKMVGNEGRGEIVWTDGDARCFTQVLYLGVPSEIVAEQCKADESRKRTVFSREELDKWQLEERIGLEEVCRRDGIHFSLLARNDQLLDKATTLLRDFKEGPAVLNLRHAEVALDNIMENCNAKLETMLVLDADRTLCAVDTGNMFWEELGAHNRLKELFSGPLKYSLNAFLHASALYTKATDPIQFETTCKAVAAKVEIHPEFLRLLRRVEGDPYFGAVVVTCGLRRVWEMVLGTAGLSNSVKVIGADRIDDEYVVTAKVKAALVKRLQEVYGMHIWAFGDSPLDLPMLKQADEAIVVVGEQGGRSKTMNTKLEVAIAKECLVVRQALLPSHASLRLDIEQLPVFDMRDPEDISAIFRRRIPLTVRIASTNAAKLLQTPMRSAENKSVALQAVHKQVGWFLATELVTEVIGMEEYEIPHVQGQKTIGHRLLEEGKTTIVALMRGGEPMAKGVHKAFPTAMFVHANKPSDLTAHHLACQKTVLLVDSVVNNGTTIVEFVNRIKRLAAGIRIVVVTGVAQKKSVAEKGPLARVGRDGMVVAALRLSDNKYTGKGGTDTGNRLFNTTQLD